MSNKNACPEFRSFLTAPLGNTEGNFSKWEHSQSASPDQCGPSPDHNLPQGVACQPAQSLRTWEKPWGVTCPPGPRCPPCPRVAVQLWPGKKNRRYNSHRTVPNSLGTSLGLLASLLCKWLWWNTSLALLRLLLLECVLPVKEQA